MSSQSHALLWRRGAYQFGEQKLDLNTNSTQAAKNASSDAAGAGAAATDSTQKKRRVTQAKFTPNNLIADNGLSLIYEEFPKMNFSMQPGKELKNLQLLLTKYKEWMYQLYPLNFEELTRKIEAMSGNRLIHNELERIRNKRDGIDDNLNDEFTFNDNDNENENENNNENDENSNDFEMSNEMKHNNNANNKNKSLDTDLAASNSNNNNNNKNDSNSNNNNSVNEEMEDIDIDIETRNVMQQMPGDDEDAMADMLFDEF